MKLALVGATGRMGQTILRLAREDRGVELVGACDAPGSSLVGQDVGELARLGAWGVALSASVEDAILGAEVCIDFSSPRGTAAVARACARAGVALVSGTTGIDDDARRALDEAARSIPVLWAPNTSVGVQVLAELVREAVARLGPGFDIEVVEVHHRRKVDAPSGTALRLVEAAKEARDGLAVVSGREGTPGARKPEEIGVFAVRGGDVIGDHSVHLLGDGERIELTHRATSRDLFARGALRAAHFVLGKAPQRYTMRDVLAGSLYSPSCETITTTGITITGIITSTTTVPLGSTAGTTVLVAITTTALLTTGITTMVVLTTVRESIVGAASVGRQGRNFSIWNRPRCSSRRPMTWCVRSLAI